MSQKNMSKEIFMKSKGEGRVWKGVVSKTGNPKSVTQTQLGQQLILSDAIRVLPIIESWINNKKSNYRKDLLEYFESEQVKLQILSKKTLDSNQSLMQKVTETLLLLAASSHITREEPKKIHTRHKSVNLIRKKVMEDLSFELVWRLLEVIIEPSEYFKVEKSITAGDKNILTNLKYICTLPETMTLSLAQKAHFSLFPEPMLAPPIDWSFRDNVLAGGYQSFQFDLIRTKAFRPDYSMYSKHIFDAINYIQSVPWRVNEAMVKTVDSDLVMPRKEDFIHTVYPEIEPCQFGIDLKKKNLSLSDLELKIISKSRDIFRDQLEMYNAEKRDFESAMGKFRAVKLALGIAKRYIGEENIYFPHSYDFRGRIYPIPVGLSPQGSDAVKSMLEYAEGEELNEAGIGWSWAYLCSLWGDDKITFEERIEKGKSLLFADYKEADEPYQFLAHQLEMREFEKNPSHKVKARIHLDACNSGSQFTSAITGDKAGCIATNVLPTINQDGSQTRQDAYLLVAEKSVSLTEKVIEEKTEDVSALKFFLSLLNEKGRKVCKKPVMVSNYGGTSGGRSKIIWDQLREFKVDRKWITKKGSSLYSRILGSSIAGVLNGGKAFETYIH